MALGLFDTLGAFLAGVLLAETKYRCEVIKRRAVKRVSQQPKATYTHTFTFTMALGLFDTLGAFLAGVLLAETKYRCEETKHRCEVIRD